MSALERNIRLRNGRRELPREIPRLWYDDAVETLGNMLKYTLIMGVIFGVMYTAFSVAERQIAIEDQINQEVNHAP